MDIRQNFIAGSARKIAEAQALVDDSHACAAKARELYGRRNNGGKWKTVQADAQKLLVNAAKNGLTVDKPVMIVNGETWGFFSESYVSFLFNCE